MTHAELRSGLNAKKKTPYLAREWVWYDNTISVEKNDREISELHNI